MENEYKGALLDERPDSEKERDFRHEEIAETAGAPSFEKIEKVKDLPFYEMRDQDGSSTCMNHAYAKLRGIRIKQTVQPARYVSLSGGFAYRRRQNKDSEGMSLPDIFAIGKSFGLPFEVVDPSNGLSEDQIVNAQELPYTDELAKVITDPNEKYVYLENDFDKVAEVVAQGIPVLIMIFTTRDEYEITPRLIEENLTPAKATIRHGICVHKAFQEGDVEYLLADESWGVPSSKARNEFDRDLKERGQRRLTREWFNKRVYGAGYIRDLKFIDGETDPGTEKPRHTFTNDLEFVPTYTEDPEVKILQDILKYEACFPADVASSGWFGSVTRNAVGAFQLKRKILQSADEPGYGRVGPITRAKLNELYGA